MSNVKCVDGDILEARALCNPVNLVGAMGKGLAAQVARRWPACLGAYRAALQTRALRAGTVSAWRRPRRRMDPAGAHQLRSSARRRSATSRSARSWPRAAGFSAATTIRSTHRDAREPAEVAPAARGARRRHRRRRRAGRRSASSCAQAPRCGSRCSTDSRSRSGARPDGERGSNSRSGSVGRPVLAGRQPVRLYVRQAR